MAKIPLSPSTITSRRSSDVGATKLTREYPCRFQIRTVSAPVRVLPYPRPARISQTAHSPRGSVWFGRAQEGQS
jgi:hypothetical protein